MVVQEHALETIPDARALHLFFEQERRAEREAVQIVAEPYFTECLVKCKLKTEIKVSRIVSKESRAEIIRAQDVFAAWHKYASTRGMSRLAKGHLTGQVEPLTTDFAYWLTHEYTPRYRAVVEENYAWLTDICRLVVMRRIMEVKHYNQVFSDDVARAQMDLVMILRKMYQIVGKVSHHMALENRELAESIMAGQKELLNAVLENRRASSQTPLPPIAFPTKGIEMPPEESHD